MEWFYDMLLIVVPMALMIILAYVLLNQYMQGQLTSQSMQISRDRSKDTLAYKLNAYERLALFLERISFPDLIMRVHAEKMETYTLYQSLLLTIQKEYEHNLSQQVYISENLWTIIRLSKQELATLITDVYSQQPDSKTEVFISALLSRYTSWEVNPIDKARSAVRAEASLLL